MKQTKFKFWHQEILLVVGHSNETFKVCNLKLTIQEINRGIVHELIHESGFRKYVVVFNADHQLSVDMIAHETWHLFFDLLDYVSDNTTSYNADELSKEAYTILFTELFKLLNEKAFSLLFEQTKEDDKNGEESQN